MFRTGAGCRYGSTQDFRVVRLQGAKVSVSYSGDPGNVLEEVRTDSDGRSPVLDLPTPPVEYSLEPNVNQPYSEYTVKVEAEGYSPVEVTGSELLSGQSSVQPVEMDELTPDAFQDIAIPDHTLFGDYRRRFRRRRSNRWMRRGKLSSAESWFRSMWWCMTAPRRIPRQRLLCEISGLY